MQTPFTPGNTVTLPVTTTSSSVELPHPGLAPSTLMITEAVGLEICFLAFGDASVQAEVPAGDTPTDGLPILAGSTQPITVPGDVTHVAAITASGNATLYLTKGDGA